jgi:hypothetical protein
MLRCSTNFLSPTENFRDIDKEIVESCNNIIEKYFKHKVKLNHVLAQIYYNHQNGNKQRKARIPAHSDKTLDMPENGVIVFCTFYNRKITSISSGSKSYSAELQLSILRFRKKKNVEATEWDNYPDKWDLTLYPDSIFIISLEFNRVYTHEIVPPYLPLHLIPTRMGYTIRCSKTKAIYGKDSKVRLYSQDSTNISILQTVDSEYKDKIRKYYKEENMTSNKISYESISIKSTSHHINPEAKNIINTYSKYLYIISCLLNIYTTININSN